MFPGLLRSSIGEQVVAIKVLKESASRSAEEDFVREVSIMSAFRHDNILTLVGVVYRGKGKVIFFTKMFSNYLQFLRRTKNSRL